MNGNNVIDSNNGPGDNSNDGGITGNDSGCTSDSGGCNRSSTTSDSSGYNRGSSTTSDSGGCNRGSSTSSDIGSTSGNCGSSVSSNGDSGFSCCSRNNKRRSSSISRGNVSSDKEDKLAAYKDLFFQRSGREVCTICLDEIDVASATNKCAHLFCLTCLKQWVEKEKRAACPNCRAIFDEILYVDSSSNNDNIAVYNVNRRFVLKEHYLKEREFLHDNINRIMNDTPWSSLMSSPMSSRTIRRDIMYDLSEPPEPLSLERIRSISTRRRTTLMFPFVSVPSPTNTVSDICPFNVPSTAATITSSASVIIAARDTIATTTNNNTTTNTTSSTTNLIQFTTTTTTTNNNNNNNLDSTSITDTTNDDSSEAVISTEDNTDDVVATSTVTQ